MGYDAGAYSDASAPASATTPAIPDGGYTSIWQDADGPQQESIVSTPTDVGIRFHSDVAGDITAPRTTSPT